MLQLETAAAQGADSGKYEFACGDVFTSKIRPSLAKVTLRVDVWSCSAKMNRPALAGGCEKIPEVAFCLSPGFTA